MTNPRQVLTRSIIFERVWGYDFGFASNSLDVYIGYLRRKTEAGGEAAPDPDGSRRRLRAARAVSFRARLTLVAAAAVALAVVVLRRSSSTSSCAISCWAPSTTR